MSWRHISTACLAAGGVLLLAGCGGSTTATPSAHTTATTTTTTRAQTVASGAGVLRRAVVAAIDADHKTSNRALWTNTVPARPAGVAGPALTALRQSVAGRRKQGIKIRMLHESFRIVSTQIAPSYETATAVVLDIQRVQPTHPNGRPFGRSVTLNERVLLELHRTTGRTQFVVWKVKDAK